MGFDLFGKNQLSEKGKYFRNNCWWWRPLWGYVNEVCCDILTEEDYKCGTFNDGHLIDDNKARMIADRLDLAVSSGAAARYAEKYKEDQASLPDEPCMICNGTGQRHDEVVDGQCNACNGTGKRENWGKSYPFDVDNVKEFSEFCRESGGFEIC